MNAPATVPSPALDRFAGRRVLYVCLDPGVPVFGRKGCSVHVQEVLRVLQAAGAQVELVAARLGGERPHALRPMRVHRLELPETVDAAARERALIRLDDEAGRLVSSVLDRGPSAALLYERYALFSASALVAARRAGVPSVLEVNAPLPVEQARHRSLVAVDEAYLRTRRALRSARRVVGVSSPVAAWASDLAGVPALVVPNGVDVERFRPRRATVDRRAVPPGRTPFTVAFVGGFRPWHGVDLLVRAAARLQADTGRVVRLLLIGDGAGRAQVLALAASQRVEVDSPGALDPAAVPAALAQADAAAAPYREGGGYFSPLKVAEYLAAGLPTVVARTGDLADLYADGEELLVVPPGDVAALAAALGRLATEPGLADRLAASGRTAVERRFTWRSVVERSLQEPDGQESVGPELPVPQRLAPELRPRAVTA